MTTPIIDTHVHFWDPSRLTYPWLASVQSLQHAFTPTDYRSEFSSVPIEKMVFVECNVRADQCEQAVAWIESLVPDEPRLAAIVAFADLTVAGERARTGQPDRLLAQPLVASIRHNIQGEARGSRLQVSFVVGVQTIHRLGAPFELCVTHDQLDDVSELSDCAAQAALWSTTAEFARSLTATWSEIQQARFYRDSAINFYRVNP